MTGAGPGLEKFKMPGRDWKNLKCRAGPGFDFFNAGAGIFLLPRPGRDLNFFIAGAGAGPGSKILK